MADAPNPPADAARTEAAAAFESATLSEAGPVAGPGAFSDPDTVDASADIGAIFGLPPAGPQGGQEDAGGGQGAPPAPASAAGQPGAEQAPGTHAPTPGSAPGASQPAGGTAQPPTPSIRGEPLPPVALGAPPPPAAPAQGPGQQGAQPSYDPRDLELASLRAQVEQLTRGQQPPTQGAPPAGQQPQSQGQPGAMPAYPELQVPADYLQALQGEDQRLGQYALSNLLQQSAGIVHQKIIAEVRQMFDNELQTFRASLQSDQQTQSAIDDYYSHFPQHKAAGAIVAQEVQAMQSQFPGAPYNENYRNALGARVNQALAALTGASAGNGAPAPPAPSTPPTPPAPPLPPSNRQSLGGTDPGQFMMETFLGVQ